MSDAIVGIDIGATGIRAVETIARGNTLQVRRAAAAPLPPGAVSGGVIENPTLVAAALRDLFRKGRFTTRKVATVIGADPAVLIRPAEVPYQPSAADQRAVVRAEADKFLPVAVDELYLDHHVIAVTPRENEDGSTTPLAMIALVGARRSAVDALVTTVENAGLEPVSIDVTAFALSRFVSMASSGPGIIDAIVHIGADTVSLIAVADGQPAQQRALNTHSGAKLTGQIQEQLACPLPVAETLKVTVATLTGPEAQTVNEIVGAWAGLTVDAILDLLGRITRGLGMPLGRVWLSGGGARLYSLAARLKAQLGAQGNVAVLEPSTWVGKPDRLVKAADTTGQDFTIALAASIR